MKETGFVMETVTTTDGKKEKRIRMHTVDDTEYVSFYKNGRIMPIPYDCLVCFVANNIDDPAPVPPGVAALERLNIGLEE